MWTPAVTGSRRRAGSDLDHTAGADRTADPGPYGDEREPAARCRRPGWVMDTSMGVLGDVGLCSALQTGAVTRAADATARRVAAQQVSTAQVA
ncbi:hypothetical protein AQJ66_16310 [Streptomyces bungoensis]|uniref:Uncharacterized protein n=1 Tax=Streptomyces bungoensis TaxID=285568 RepID=A0A101T1M3_9ACTN|nr:hypothetical protein AQJ66_16310 [Streptomyces bungoensis]